VGRCLVVVRVAWVIGAPAVACESSITGSLAGFELTRYALSSSTWHTSPSDNKAFNLSSIYLSVLQ
jgi:hypothetical protein